MMPIVLVLLYKQLEEQKVLPYLVRIKNKIEALHKVVRAN